MDFNQKALEDMTDLELEAEKIKRERDRDNAQSALDRVEAEIRKRRPPNPLGYRAIFGR